MTDSLIALIEAETHPNPYYIMGLKRAATIVRQHTAAQTSEISVIIEEEAVHIIAKAMQPDLFEHVHSDEKSYWIAANKRQKANKRARKAYTAIKPYLATRKPVSVDDVTRKVMVAEGRGHEIDDIDHVNNWRREAKAVLDAAGVAYVD